MGAHELLGWGTTRQELQVPSGIAPRNRYVKDLRLLGRELRTSLTSEKVVFILYFSEPICSIPFRKAKPIYRLIVSYMEWASSEQGESLKLGPCFLKGVRFSNMRSPRRGWQETLQRTVEHPKMCGHCRMYHGFSSPSCKFHAKNNHRCI